MRQSLFKMTAVGVGTTIMGFCSWGRGGIETGLNSKYNKEKGGIYTQGRRWGSGQ